MKKRNTTLVLWLTILTLGILYPIVWSSLVQKDLRKASNFGFNWLVHFFLGVITFSIYIVFWYDKASLMIGAIFDEPQNQEWTELYARGNIGPLANRSMGLALLFLSPHLIQKQINNISNESVERVKKT